MDPRPGALLVATPELLDPNFADTVVLLLDTNDEGALGVVLNRPSVVQLDVVLEPWVPLATAPDVLFQGGPVGTDGALGLAAVPDPGDAPVGWSQCFGVVGMVDLDAPPELAAGGFTGFRVYAGYAGWGAGQLERELAEGSWWLVDSRPEDLFRGELETLRRDVLRRQPGERAWASTRPADPSWN